VACTWGVNKQPKTREAAEAQKQIARANARLIAAAPELLEALKDVVHFWEQIDCTNDLYVKSRAVIAKAEGGAA